MRRIFTCFVFLLLPVSLLGQVNHNDKEGVSETQEDGLTVVFDEFTGDLNIVFNDFYKINYSINDREMLAIPFFMGNIEKDSFFDVLFGDATPQIWGLAFISEPKIFFDNINNLDNNADSLSVPFLVDNDRMMVDTYFIPDSSEISSNDNWIFILTDQKWNQITTAKEVKFRITGQVTQIPDSTLLQMTRISDKLNELRNEKIEEEKVPPEVEEAEEVQEGVEINGVEEAEEVQEGVEINGVEEGTSGEINVDEGTGSDSDRSAPYELQWDGDRERSPMVQPMPAIQTNEETTITVRFEVNPDGSLGRVVPLRKMNPELEREVMRTLRSWRFSRLPENVPQEPQWGRITFRFVLD